MSGHPAAKAQAIATRLVEVMLNEGLAHHAMIVGSLRRQRETVNDIDIVVAPVMMTVQGGLFSDTDDIAEPEPLDQWLAWKVKESQGRVTWATDADGNVRKANNLRAITVDGILVELWLTTPSADNWGALVQMRTGPAEWNIGMIMRAKQLGLTYKAGYGIFGEKGRVDQDTEESIFHVLGLPTRIPPRRRDEPALIAALKAGHLTLETLMPGGLDE